MQVGSQIVYVLMLAWGTWATGRLPFGEERERGWQAIILALAAAPFLAGLVQGPSNFLAGLVRDWLGEAPPTGAFTEFFSALSPWQVFLLLLLGAGLFEELLFRYGLMKGWRGSRAVSGQRSSSPALSSASTTLSQEGATSTTPARW